MYLQEIVSVPYWGSNYLMGVGKSTTIGLIVSVPYWGSNYLIVLSIHRCMIGVSVPYWGSNYLITPRGYRVCDTRFPSPTGVLII